LRDSSSIIITRNNFFAEDELVDIATQQKAAEFLPYRNLAATTSIQEIAIAPPCLTRHNQRPPSSSPPSASISSTLAAFATLRGVAVLPLPLPLPTGRVCVPP
jgi:hypothetical protein